MLMKAAKFSKQKRYFLTFFCPTNNLVALILVYPKRHQSSTRQTESVSHRTGCRQLKDRRQVKHC